MPLREFQNTVVLNKDAIEAPNLVDRLSSEDLSYLGGVVWNGYQYDDWSRAKWLKRNEAGMDLAQQVQKAKNFPWPGAANVTFPLISIAALQFSARSQNIMKGGDIVSYKVVGEEISKQLQERSYRISNFMSWQVAEEDRNWITEHDRLLVNLAIVGTNFVKTYYSSHLGRVVGELVMAKDLIINYFAKSVEDAQRKSQRIELSRNEVHERMMEETFRDVKDEGWYTAGPATLERSSNALDARHNQRSGLSPPPVDEETPFSFIEQHRYLDLDKDGYAEPYIVTIEESSKCVVRVVARVDKEEQIDRKAYTRKIIKIAPTEYYNKYTFIPAFDGGMYDIGFGTLLGPLNESVNSGINQLLDNGTMQNASGGFLGRGAKIRGGVYTMSPWEWKRVDSSGDDLRKNLVPNPERRPNVVMFQLLNLLIQYTDRLSSTTDAMVGKLPGQNTPASTYQTSLEQGLEVYTSIFGRVWRAMKDEFKLRHLLNGKFLPLKKRFGESNQFVFREDFKSNPDHVVPTADPNTTSTSMKIFQAQSIRQAAMGVAGYDMDEVEMNFLRAMKVQNPRQIYPGSKKIPPPPDAKVILEQLKLKSRAMELRIQQQQFALQMMEEKRLNDAKIIQLQSQAAKLVAEADAVDGDSQLKSIESIVNTLKTFGEALDQRIDTMTKLEKEAQKNDAEEEEEEETEPEAEEEIDEDEDSPSPTDSGPGIPGMDDAGSDLASISVPEEVQGESEGSMGGEDV